MLGQANASRSNERTHGQAPGVTSDAAQKRMPALPFASSHRRKSSEPVEKSAPKHNPLSINHVVHAAKRFLGPGVDYLASCGKVTTLALGCKGLTALFADDSDDSAANLGPSKPFDYLQQCRSLQTLQLEENFLRSTKGLELLPTLTAVYLDNNQITSVGPAGRLPRLEVLKLKGNRIALVDGIDPSTTIHILDLSHQGMPGAGGPIPGGVRFSAAAMQALAGSLTSLSLAYNGMRSIHDAQRLGAAAAARAGGEGAAAAGGAGGGGDVVDEKYGGGGGGGAGASDLHPSLGSVLWLSKLRAFDFAGNFVDDLNEVVDLCRACPDIVDLSFAGNPVSKHPRYRSSVMSLCRDLLRLDGKDVTENERMFYMGRQWNRARLQQQQQQGPRGQQQGQGEGQYGGMPGAGTGSGVSMGGPVGGAGPGRVGSGSGAGLGMRGQQSALAVAGSASLSSAAFPGVPVRGSSGTAGSRPAVAAASAAEIQVPLGGLSGGDVYGPVSMGPLTGSHPVLGTPVAIGLPSGAYIPSFSASPYARAGMMPGRNLHVLQRGSNGRSRQSPLDNPLMIVGGPKSITASGPAASSPSHAAAASAAAHVAASASASIAAAALFPQGLPSAATSSQASTSSPAGAPQQRRVLRERGTAASADPAQPAEGGLAHGSSRHTQGEMSGVAGPFAGVGIDKGMAADGGRAGFGSGAVRGRAAAANNAGEGPDWQARWAQAADDGGADPFAAESVTDRGSGPGRALPGEGSSTTGPRGRGAAGQGKQPSAGAGVGAAPARGGSMYRAVPSVPFRDDGLGGADTDTGSEGADSHRWTGRGGHDNASSPAKPKLIPF